MPRRVDQVGDVLAGGTGSPQLRQQFGFRRAEEILGVEPEQLAESPVDHVHARAGRAFDQQQDAVGRGLDHRVEPPFVAPQLLFDAGLLGTVVEHQQHRATVVLLDPRGVETDVGDGRSVLVGQPALERGVAATRFDATQRLFDGEQVASGDAVPQRTVVQRFGLDAEKFAQPAVGEGNAAAADDRDPGGQAAEHGFIAPLRGFKPALEIDALADVANADHEPRRVLAFVGQLPHGQIGGEGTIVPALQANPRFDPLLAKFAPSELG